MNVLFDMDGVLVDSKDAWFRSFQDIGEVNREEFERRYWGRDLEANVKDLGTTRAEFCETVLPRYLHEIDLVPEAKAVLSSLTGKKALITNTTSRCTARILKQHDLNGYFDAIVTSDEVDRGKPDPAIIELAMSRIGAVSDDTVVIGDSDHDIKAGKAAGCITVGIGVDADHRVERLSDLPPVLAQLEIDKAKKGENR